MVKGQRGEEGKEEVGWWWGGGAGMGWVTPQTAAQGANKVAPEESQHNSATETKHNTSSQM